MSASQGAAPSTFWGEDVLAEMRKGTGAAQAVERITQADAGRAFRQLSALDLRGQTGAFTGASNEPERGHLGFAGGVAAGNMLTGASVLDAMADQFATSAGALEDRLLAALRTAAQQGGDFRGLLSAALLVLHPDRPPLTLRIDHHQSDPVGALEALQRRATTGDYAIWAKQVPVATDRERVLD
jgi:uncharacterized Ntn-hydrolase superfamily protein